MPMQTRLFNRTALSGSISFRVREIQRPNPSASFGQLLDGLEVLEDEKQIAYQIDQIIAKLQRKKRKLRCDHFGYGIFKGGRVEKW